MRRTIGFIVAAIGILAYATLLLVGVPSLQLDDLELPVEHPSNDEQVNRGREIYIQSGCIYCHTQQPRDVNFGPDQERNWGRFSIPADYVGDRPHLLGTMRTGPDLHNIAARQPSEDWHLIHLYQPRAVLPNSVMPSYQYLFTHVNEVPLGSKEVNVPKNWLPEGAKVIATQEALDLVAYLKSLDHTYSVEQDSSQMP
ncbi:cbb3-type cytochrome c oxidase subunit II [Pelagicoccus sp. SDUM812003]|uniref:cbb3-type cytochrome c oxidase subunit II n=1 Tax=Pelagicoccus sp. SDUM812003 TaxID=3041267 RepID=UPI00280E2631|nr:cbb3-type cytochrome c oxidase subunit II [Pelagicoccus sp. SDUM812003]MDQ8203051.1 cbb3-type cytochrome c oxidase subunit II [Pelagicoccus sp. SDUM812003]